MSHRRPRRSDRTGPSSGQNVDSASLTVGEYLEQWLAGKQALRPSTRQSYAIHIRRYLIPYLGDLQLAALQPGQIEQMYRQLVFQRETNAPGAPSVATLQRIQATLTSALNTAVRRGLLERNPAATVELPRVHKPRIQTWSAAELRRFLEVTTDDPLHLLYLLLALFGLRRGEVVALRWSDVDLNRGLLRVEQSAVRVRGRTVIGPPKSASAARTIALDEETCRRLQWHACRQRLDTLKATGRTFTPQLVFTNPDGSPLDPTYVSRHFDRLVAQHGLPRIRLHDLRHTSASIGLASGESLLQVSRRLGHSSIRVTADIYSHISPEVAREAAERLAHQIFGK